MLAEVGYLIVDSIFAIHDFKFDAWKFFHLYQFAFFEFEFWSGIDWPEFISPFNAT